MAEDLREDYDERRMKRQRDKMSQDNDREFIVPRQLLQVRATLLNRRVMEKGGRWIADLSARASAKEERESRKNDASQSGLDGGKFRFFICGVRRRRHGILP